MDNERDEILNDLIKYYETDDIESTTVVGITAPTQDDEDVLGDTMVVRSEQREAIDSTQIVNSPESDAYYAPEDEIFGNLDLAGRPISDATRRTDIDTPMTEQVKKSPEPVIPKSRKTDAWNVLKPLWVTLILCAVALGGIKFYITDTGPIKIYKRNFTYNFSLILKVFGVDIYDDTEIPVISKNDKVSSFLEASGLMITAYAENENSEYKYDAIDKKLSTIPFAGADLAKFYDFKDGVVCAKSNYLCFVNKKGEKEWEYTTPISDPILSANGDYIAIAANNSTQISLYEKDELIYSIDAPNKIKSCSVSERGDVAIVTEKSAYKGAVSVLNRKGEEVFSWVSGVNYITSATVTKNRRVSVSLVSTEDTLKSYVMVFDIYTPDPLSGTELPNTLVYSISSHKNNTLSFGDNSIASVNSDGNLIYNVRFDDMEITHTASDNNGWRIVSYTDDNLPYVNVYDKKGKLRYCTETEAIPNHTDLYKSYVVYNNGRDVICGKASDNTKTKYTAPMAVKNLIMINKNTYMIAYENSLEIIRV